MDERLMQMIKNQKDYRKLYREKEQRDWDIRKKILFKQYRTKNITEELKTEIKTELLKTLYESDFCERDGKIILLTTV
jgi:hypothetical protein